MKENTKTILAMIGLIAIGFVGGFFTHVQLTKKHLEQIAKEATIMGFEDRLFRIIGADENQRKELAPVINKYAQRLEHSRIETHQNRKAILDSLKTEIEGELSEKQLERLGRFLHRHMRFKPPHEKKLEGREKMPH